MTESILVAFIASVFAVPGVTSLITSVIRKATDTIGVDPRIVVYVVAYALVGGIMASGGIELPAWTGDPFLYVVAWSAVATATAEAARRLYDVLLSHLPGLAPSA